MSGFNYCQNISYSSDKAVDIGRMSVVCKWCGALKWVDETVGMCCSSGKTRLPAFKPIPDPLRSLITGDHPQSKHFLANARKYNGCFQMTSFGATEIREGNFTPTVKVQSQVYHRMGSLLPEAGQAPKFLEIYFVDDNDREVQMRCSNLPGVKQG